MGETRRLWQSRSGLLVWRVRFSSWNAVLLFAAGIIMYDLQKLGIGERLALSGPLPAEAMGYAAGLLVFAFLPRDLILGVGKAGAALALAMLVIGDLAPLNVLHSVYILGPFAGGLCLGCSFYVFFSVLNNSERFFSLIVIQLYFAVCVYGLWGNASARAFFSGVAAYIFTLFFMALLFSIRKGSIPKKKPPPKRAKCGSEDDCCHVGAGVIGSVLYVYAIFMAIYTVSRYLVHYDDYVDRPAFSIGALVAIAGAGAIQLLYGKSALYTWKIFFIGSLLSLTLLAIDSVFDARAGSLFFGLANSMGYIAIFYLLGGVARLTDCLKFFRLFCIVEFLLSFALRPLVGHAFARIDENNNLIALILMIVIVCFTFSRYSVLYRNIFESDWIHDLNMFKHIKADNASGKAKGADLTKVGRMEADRMEGYGLTPRERQIFGMMLTEMSVKQIMIDLEISRGTFNFHTANLYRKLGIQSRTELFAKFGRL